MSRYKCLKPKFEHTSSQRSLSSPSAHSHCHPDLSLFQEDDLLLRCLCFTDLASKQTLQEIEANNLAIAEFAA